MSFSGRNDPAVELVRPALSSCESDHVRVGHTLTSMGRPRGPVIERELGAELAGLAGFSRVDVRLVFDPQWTPERMSDDAKFLLGVYGG